MRSLLIQGTAGEHMGAALAWSLGILAVFYSLALMLYRRRDPIPVPQ
jgi:hypothetical protein